MANLKDFLSENAGYYRDLARRLKARLAKLPLGSILKRRLSGRDYYYLKVRKGSRVLSKYLGKKRPLGIEESIKERRLLKHQLRGVEKNLRLLHKMNGRRRG